MTLSLLAGVFAAAFFSATLLFGISEPALIAAVQAENVSMPALFLAATAGNLLGSTANYALGRYLLRFEGRDWFPVDPAPMDSAERLLARYGQPLLLLSWMPFVGDPLTFAAGLLRMNFVAFLLYTGIGKAARYALVLWLFV